MTSSAESVCSEVVASALEVVSLCSWQCEVHDGTPEPDKNPSRSLARSFCFVLSSVSRPTTHSLPSCCFVLHCGCCCPSLPSPSLVLRRRRCRRRRLRVASNSSAVAAVSPPTATTVSLARSLARSVDVGSAATATVTVVEIIVGEREREGGPKLKGRMNER